MDIFNDNDMEEFALPFASTSELKGKQSVRATFKLTARAIEALSILSAQLGIKQKSLFDHLIDDIHALQLVAQKVEGDDIIEVNRVQKTFVLSRKTLTVLEQTSKQFQTPRDALVEYSLQRLIPLIATERKKHRQRKEIAADIDDFIKRGQAVLKKARAVLDRDDPVLEQFEAVMRGCDNAKINIDHTIEKGEILESF
jgi:hypothetical protein